MTRSILSPVPTGDDVRLLEERFVMTVYGNRMLVKKLRLVKPEMYLSNKARTIATALLNNQPVLHPIPDLEPFTAQETAEAVDMIGDYYLMRKTMDHGKELYDASVKGDLKAVQKILQHKPTRAGTNLGDSIGLSVSKYVSKIAAGTKFKQFASPLTTRFPLEEGAIHVVAGGPGSGKSAWTECLAWELSKGGTVVGDFSIELPETPKIARYAQHLRGPSVGLQAYVTNTVDTVLMAEAAREILANTNLKLITTDSNIGTLEGLKDAIRYHAEEHGMQVAIIDFLQLISVPGVPKTYEKLDIITNELKALGDELGIAQIWLTQLNREGRKGDLRPKMEHIEGAGKIEQLAWSVAVIDAKENPTSSVKDVNLYFDKSRYGGTGVLKAKFDGSNYDFVLDGQKPLMERTISAVPTTII